jgi:hypothetical protein
MSSFAQGFNQGAGIYNNAERNRLLQEANLREQERFSWEQKQQAGKEALRVADLNVSSMGDTMQTVIPSSIDSKEMPEGEMGPYAESQVVPMSKEQKAALFKKEALGGGASPADIMNYQKGALDLELGANNVKKSGFELKDLERQQKFKEDVAEINDMFAKGDYAGIIERTQGAYNKPPKGSILDDGYTGKVVRGGNGSASFVQYDKNGKEVSTTPITRESVEEQLPKIFFAKYQALDFKGASELKIKDRTATAAEKQATNSSREVDIKEAMLPFDQRVKTAYAGFLNRRDGSSGNGSNKGAMSQQQFDEYANTLVGSTNPLTGQKIKDINEAKAYAYKVKFKDPELRMNVMGQLNEAEKEWRKLGIDEDEIEAKGIKFLSRKGFAPPELLRVYESGQSPKGKPAITVDDYIKFNNKYPMTQVEIPANLLNPPTVKSAIDTSVIPALPRYGSAGAVDKFGRPITKPVVDPALKTDGFDKSAIFNK